MKRSRAKSRDDIMALMHVTYIGDDAVPLQQDTEMRHEIAAGWLNVASLVMLLMYTDH